MVFQVIFLLAINAQMVKLGILMQKNVPKNVQEMLNLKRQTNYVQSS